MLSNLRTLVSDVVVASFFKNSLWMLLEFFVRIVATFVVTFYVARHLGPEHFGSLSYVLAITAVFLEVSRIGMRAVLIRDVASDPASADVYLGTGMFLMWIAAIACLVGMASAAWWLESDPDVQYCLIVLAIALLFQAFSVADYSLQGRVEARYSTYAKSAALAIGATVKIYLVTQGAGIKPLVWAYLIEHACIAMFLCVVHHRRHGSAYLRTFSFELVPKLMRSAWPLLLSSISILLYMRMDHVMIRNMLDAEQLGLYASATTLFEAWVALAALISMSLLPAFVRFKNNSPEEYERHMGSMFAVLFWIGVAAAVASYFLSETVIGLAFGQEYAGAAAVLALIMCSAPFTAIGSATARYLTVEGFEKKIALRTAITLALNIAMNLILIPRVGIMGAGVATLIALVFGNYLVNYFDPDLVQLRRICHRAIAFNLLRGR